MLFESFVGVLHEVLPSTAVSAVTGRGGVRVTVPGHSQALPFNLVTASVKDLYQMRKIPEQCSKHFLPVLGTLSGDLVAGV